MDTSEFGTPARKVRRKVPISEQAETVCSHLWEDILTLTQPEDFPKILRLSRRGIKLANIAQSTYYREAFMSMRDTMERRLST